MSRKDKGARKGTGETDGEADVSPAAVDVASEIDLPGELGAAPVTGRGNPFPAPTAEEAANRDAAIAAMDAERAGKVKADPLQALRDELAAVQARIAEAEAGKEQSARNVQALNTAIADRDRESKLLDQRVSQARGKMDLEWLGSKGQPGLMHLVAELPGLRKRADELRAAIG